MKYIVILFLSLVGYTASAQIDAIEKYFGQYMEDEDFTVVYVSPKMFNLISRLDLNEVNEDPDAKLVMETVKDIRGLRVLTTDVKPMERYKEAMNMISTKEYEVLVTVRDKGENVRIWVKEDNKVINELLLLVGALDEFVMLSFVGNIDLEKISRLANELDVKGVEHLDKVGKGQK
jgi:hypothetical protein